MAGRAVKLSEKSVKQLDTLIRNGRYKSADAAIAAGLKLLSAQTRKRKAREQTLEEALREGEASLARGDVVSLKSPKDIETFFRNLTSSALRKAKR